MNFDFLRRLRLDGFLSFATGNESIHLEPLNVLIGPNASGKSNVIEAIELLRATPTDLAAAIRDGGGALEWLWKGQSPARAAIIDVETGIVHPWTKPLRYRLEFASVQSRLEITDEAIENAKKQAGKDDVFFYYRFQRGNPVINIKSTERNREPKERHLERASLEPDQSVLAQRKDPDLYPEVTWFGRQFAAIQFFREWTFGRSAALRLPQPADLPEDRLAPDSRNLPVLLNQIEHRDGRRFNELLKRFLPRFERMSTRISGGTVQFYLHETELSSAVPATRLSDGTLRFVALLAIFLSPDPPPLVCIEEPELGLHPDAIGLIGELLIEVSKRMQLIVTTHSDVLISALTEQIDSVIICENSGAGTTLRHLDADRLSFWLAKYKLGEVWRMGEIGGNP